MANSEWRMVNEKLSTRNAQPSTHFGANAPPTRHFYALRFQLTFKRDMGQGTRDKTAAISEW